MGIRYFKYKDGLPILGYHHIVSDEEKEKYYADNRYVLSISVFEKQMQYLYDHNFKTLTLDEVYEYYYHDLKIPENSVVLTFDDGFSSFNEIVKPIMEKYDFQATCFVIGRKTELENTKEKGKYTYLRKEDLKNSKNIQYYSHSYNLHHHAGKYKKQMEVESYDFIKQDFIKNETIVKDSYFAFPYGRSSDNAKKVLKERNVKLAFGYAQNHNMIKDSDPYLLPRFLMFDCMPMFMYKWVVH